MRGWAWAVLGVAVATGPAADAGAATACATTGSADAAVRPLGLSGDQELLISATMAPRLMKLNYRAALVGGQCSRGTLEAGGTVYRLEGEDTDAGPVRAAVPERKGRPVALLVPVSDVRALIAAATSHATVPVSGFLLLTMTDKATTGWRFYSAIPTDAALGPDLRMALEGTGRPIYRAEPGADGNARITLFVNE